MDTIDTVTLDVPLMIRLLEHAREDLKSDTELHKVAENLVNLGANKTLSMTDFESIVGIKPQETKVTSALQRLTSAEHTAAVVTTTPVTNLAELSEKAYNTAKTKNKPQTWMVTLVKVSLPRPPTSKELKTAGFVYFGREEPRSKKLAIVWSWADGFPGVDLVNEPSGDGFLELKGAASSSAAYANKVQTAFNRLVELVNT